MFCRSVFVLWPLPFGHCIVRFLRRFTADYTFGIFKLLHDSRIPAIGQAYLIQQYVIKLASDFGRYVSLDTLVAYIKVNKGNNKIVELPNNLTKGKSKLIII